VMDTGTTAVVVATDEVFDGADAYDRPLEA
jgi:hypothetical protein